MSNLPHHLQTIVDTICHDGCERVNDVIATLEAKDSIAETEGLSDHERERVLAELKQIMAVYERK